MQTVTDLALVCLEMIKLRLNSRFCAFQGKVIKHSVGQVLESTLYSGSKDNEKLHRPMLNSQNFAPKGTLL